LIWHDLRDANDRELDVLAERYHLHPLHIEDCRHGHQRAKVEEGADYIFAVLKPVHVTAAGEVQVSELNLFLGSDYLITVEENGECPTLRTYMDQFRSREQSRADFLFYKILDATADAYEPALDWFHEAIDDIEDNVIEKPTPEMLQRIFVTKRGLIEFRRAVSNMRDVAGHLERLETTLIQRDLAPFLRDVYDHLVRDMDMVEMQRDLLTGAMDIYLSSVANRTNQVMKVLTVLGTIALPSLVISGFFGMNLKGLPWFESPYGTWIAAGLMVASTVALLALLKKLDWL
jgi:magnesium transporter